ncbi:MAG: diphthine--ammonia ligase [Candidatus Marinimicrobia bacterium]|nr:diphthine--ammonia ligase [Candidatus Neomarinimicrobiota bacterium]
MKPESIAGHSFLCSWSGGKDSCLALYHAIRQGAIPQCLFTMLTEGGQSSRSHGLSRKLLEQQSRLMSIPILFNSATWSQYEAKFQETLLECKSQGIEGVVFGDIDVESHRDWCIRVCSANGLEALHPLWKRSRRELLTEFIELGFKSIIVATQADKLGPEWLGRTIDEQAMNELEKTGIDICGELGEYHTLVTGGPLFKSELIVSRKEVLQHDGQWFLTIAEQS